MAERLSFCEKPISPDEFLRKYEEGTTFFHLTLENSHNPELGNIETFVKVSGDIVAVGVSTWTIPTDGGVGSWSDFNFARIRNDVFKRAFSSASGTTTASRMINMLDGNLQTYGNGEIEASTISRKQLLDRLG